MFFDENVGNGNKENILIFQPWRESHFGGYPKLPMHTLYEIFASIMVSCMLFDNFSLHIL